MNLFGNSFYSYKIDQYRNQMDMYTRQLSTGKRINSARDDAAGMSVAVRFGSQIAGNQGGIRSIDQTTSALMTIDGALSGAIDVLNEMKDLTIQAQNDTLSAADRTNIQQQIDDLKAVYDDSISTFSFNGSNFLDNTTVVTMQTGSGSFTFSGKDVTDGGAEGVNLTGIDVSTTAGGQTAQVQIEASVETLLDARSYYGGKVNALSYRKDALVQQNIALQESRSRIEDADLAKAMSEFTKFQILEQSNLQMIQQRDALNYNILSLLSF
ncbi:flagellin (plasmid) [Pontibacillus sp. ALD_SL1]|uniref:flagellin n=1 Tax=Pontibacillus sp. ALD_SL1 TaxID=2777185 RepID=UPI001A95F750|nr:flagellin [Pontibacillus sp. ALD_SL1]QST03093.1 flagellin [Pontibacillus sp. ALD_SL1]